MSKLADAIRRSQRIESAPMGFGAARLAPKATMLVGYLASDADKVASAQAAGADFILLDSHRKAVDPADAEKLHTDAGTTPLGIWAPVDGASVKPLHTGGIDFVAFDPDSTPASALLEEDLGYVLILPKDPEELYLRSLEPLQLDALYLTELPSTFTVSRQIELTRIAALAHKPLVSLVKSEIASDDLQCLRAAGVIVLLVEGDTAGIGKLKESVLALPVKKPRRDERPVVSLPRSAAAAPDDDDDDDEP